MSEAAELARSLERNFAAERVGVHLPFAPATAALDELAQANARLKELEAAAAQAFPLTAPQAATWPASPPLRKKACPRSRPRWTEGRWGCGRMGVDASPPHPHTPTQPSPGNLPPSPGVLPDKEDSVPTPPHPHTPIPPHLRVFTGILLIALIAAACAPGPGPAPVEARSDLPRDTAPTVTPADYAAVAAGNNRFALDLYQHLRARPGNLFYSPYSLSAALAMAYAGARGDTERQMAATLHFTLPQLNLHPAFNALDLALTAPASDDAAFTLRVANSLWGQDGFTFQPAFLDTLARNYGAGLQLADFQDEAARERARQAINAWVARQTQDKIEELLAEGILTQDTRLVLANAIYFQGEWETPFNPESPQANFTLLSGEVVSATLMGRRATTPYVEGPNYQAVALPYKGARAEMLVILPAPGAFEAVEAALTAEQLGQIARALQPADVKLYLPRFSFATDLSLGDALSALGMPDAFDDQRADFSGMTGEPNLVIKHVIHKAVVSVDELGTEAAAATGIVMEIVSMPAEVRADRPFIFAIRDTATGTLLFLGRVVDPR